MSSSSLIDPAAYAVYDALESAVRRAAWEHTGCWDTALAIGRDTRRSAKAELEPYLAEEADRRFTHHLRAEGHVCVPRDHITAALQAVTQLQPADSGTREVAW